MTETLRSELVGTAGLSVALLGALLLTLYRRPPSARTAERRRTTMVFAVVVALQTAHFCEEYVTRFYETFPTTLGLAPWPSIFFVTFNVIWLVVWIIAAFGLSAGSQAAFAPAWFLAIAAIVNGIAHPLLALGAGGYFPGLMTSPLLAIGGIVLWRRLLATTCSHAAGDVPSRTS